MMKKLSILVLLLILAFAFPIAFAEENETIESEQSICETNDDCESGEVCTDGKCIETEIEDETNEQVQEREKYMKSNLGAKMRVLQLEKSIRRNILHGEAVVEIIEENHADYNLSTLNELLNQLNALVTELEDFDYEQTADEIALDFVDIKHRAITLSRDFRTEVSEILTDEDKQAIYDKIQSEKEQQLEQQKQRVIAAIREFNAERVQQMLQRMGIENEELVQKVRKGEAKIGDVQRETRQSLRDLTPEQKRKIVEKIRPQAVQVIQNKIRANVKQMNEEQEQVQERILAQTVGGKK